jgi:hypothetical protein
VSFDSGFLTKILRIVLIISVCVACPAQLIIIDVITIIELPEQRTCKLWICSLCMLLRPALSSVLHILSVFYCICFVGTSYKT